MITLLQNLECYCPRYDGRADILMAGDKIERLTPAGRQGNEAFADCVIDCGGLRAFPGLIDQHVHILGGGGEQGFASRVEEITAQEIALSGVATVVGLLGADDQTRSLESLYAKTKALEAQGITAYMYTGSYSVPPVTLTGSPCRDLTLIDKVIGVGEVAIADHRSSQPDSAELMKLAAQAHLGGLIGGKAGVLHLHVGDGRAGIGPLMEAAGRTELPPETFVPTHVNRNSALFEQALAYRRGGGYIDLTSGETEGLPVPQAVGRLIGDDCELARVTVSSDAHGSIPSGGSAAIGTLFDDLRACVVARRQDPERVFRLATENVARLLKLYPRKGCIQPGSDADLLLVDGDFRIRMLFAGGRLLVQDGHFIKKAPENPGG